MFLRNLSFAVTEDELLKLFKRFGPVAEIHIPLHAETKQPRGIAFVTFMMPTHAVKVINVRVYVYVCDVIHVAVCLCAYCIACACVSPLNSSN